MQEYVAWASAASGAVSALLIVVTDFWTEHGVQPTESVDIVCETAGQNDINPRCWPITRVGLASTLLSYRPPRRPRRFRLSSSFGSIPLRTRGSMAPVTLSSLSDDALKIVFEKVLEGGSCSGILPLTTVCKRWKVRMPRN
jgi:hypothetical protein